MTLSQAVTTDESSLTF